MKVTKLWGEGGGGGGGGGKGGGGRGDRRLSSPLVHDNLLYGIGSDGYLEVVDAKTGESAYRQRLNGHLRASTGRVLGEH